MIVDLVEHHGTDLWIRVEQTCSSAELSETGRIVHSETALAESSEIHSLAGLVISNRNSIWSRPEFCVRAETGQVSEQVRGKEKQVLAVRRTESETRRNSWEAVELVLVKNRIAAGLEDRPVRNAETERIGFSVGNKPAADIGGSLADVVQLDCVFKRILGVGEHFIDDHGGQRPNVARTRTRGSGEGNDVRGAIGKAALGDIRQLCAKNHSID